MDNFADIRNIYKAETYLLWACFVLSSGDLVLTFPPAELWVVRSNPPGYRVVTKKTCKIRLLVVGNNKISRIVENQAKSYDNNFQCQHQPY
jgi:hypothetical protein